MKTQIVLPYEPGYISVVQKRNARYAEIKQWLQQRESELDAQQRI